MKKSRILMAICMLFTLAGVVSASVCTFAADGAPEDAADRRIKNPVTSQVIEYVAPKPEFDNICRLSANKFGLRFKLISKMPVVYVVKYSLDGINEITKKVTVGSHTNETIWFDIPAKKGRWELHIIVTANGENVYDQTHSIVYFEEYTEQFMSKFSRWGVCNHFGREFQKPVDVDYMNMAGIKYSRDEIVWSNVEPSKGSYRLNNNALWSDNWWNNLLADNGISTLIIGSYSNPAYYEPAEWSDYKSGLFNREQYNAYARYLDELLRYVKKAEFLEVWNEPNLFWTPKVNAQDYTNLLKVSALKVRRDFPDIPIAGFAVSRVDIPYIESCMKLGAYPYFDYLSYHPYMSPRMPDASAEFPVSINKINDLILKYGGWKDPVISEMGWPTTSLYNTNEEQARGTVKQIIFSDAAHVLYNYIYQFKNDGVNDTDAERNFGIIELDNTPKNAYIAFTEMNRIIGGAIPHGKINLDIGDGSYAYLYSKDKKPVIVAWVSNGKGTYRFGSGTQVFDLYGNEVKSSDEVELNDSPVYIKNLDEIWFEKTAFYNLREAQNDWLSKYESYLPDDIFSLIKEHFNTAQAILLSAVEGGRITDEKDILNVIDTIYADGDVIIEQTGQGKNSEVNTSQMLFGLYRISEIWSNLYAVRDTSRNTWYDMTDYDAMISAACDNENARYAADNMIMQFSHEMLRYAKRYNSYVHDVIAEEDNPAKNGIIDAWNLLSVKLVSWFEKFSQFETKINLNYDLLLSSEQITAYFKENKTFCVDVGNYTNNGVKGVVEAVDGEGNVLSRSARTFVKGGGNAKADVKFQIVCAEGEMTKPVIFRFVTDNGVLVQQRYDVTVKDTIAVTLCDATVQTDKLKEICFAVKNLSTDCQTIRLKASSKEMELSMQNAAIKLEPNEEKMVYFPVKRIEKNNNNHYVFTYEVRNEYGDLLATEKVPLNFLVALKVDKPIDFDTFDGVSDAFDNAYPVYISAPDDPASKDSWGSKDISARAMFKWDTDNLYALVDVYDKNHSQKFFGTGIWQGDSVQIGIDEKNTKANQYDDFVYEFGAALTEKGINTFVWKPAAQAGEKPSDYARIVRDDDKKITHYLIKIPKEELMHMDYTDGYKFGMNISVNNANGLIRDGWYELTPGMASSKKPALWKTFELQEDTTSNIASILHCTVFEN